MMKLAMLLALCFAGPQGDEEPPDAAEAAALASRDRTRLLIIAVMIALPSISILLLLISGIQLKAFESRVPRISTQGDLDAFKAFVKTQMYLALTAMPVLYLNGLIYPAGLIFGPLDLMDLVYAVVPSIVVIVFSVLLRRVELRVQTLPAADELKHHRDVIVDKWKSSPLPDW